MKLNNIITEPRYSRSSEKGLISIGTVWQSEKKEAQRSGIGNLIIICSFILFICSTSLYSAAVLNFDNPGLEDIISFLNADQNDSALALIEKNSDFKNKNDIKEEIIYIKTKLLHSSKKKEQFIKLIEANKKNIIKFIPEILFKSGYIKVKPELKLDNKDESLNLLRSIDFYKKQEYTECIKKAEDYLEKNYCESWLKARIYMLCGYAYYFQKKFDSAAAAADEALKYTVSDKNLELKIQFFKLQAFIISNRFYETENLLKTLKNEYNSIIDEWHLDYNRALVYYKKTDYIKSLALLRTLQSSANDKEKSRLSNLLFAEIFFNTGEYEKAESFYSKLRIDYISDEYISYKYAVVLYYSKKFEESLKILSSKTFLKDEHLDFLRKYLELKIHMSSENYDKALNILKKLKDSQLYVYQPELKLVLAFCLLKNENYKNTESEINQFFSQYPGSILKNAARKILIETLFESGNFTKLEQLITEYESSDFDDREYLQLKKLMIYYSGEKNAEFNSLSVKFEEKYFNGAYINSVRFLRAMLAIRENNYNIAATSLSAITSDFKDYRIVMELLYNCYVLLKSNSEAYKLVVENKNAFGEQYENYLNDALFFSRNTGIAWTDEMLKDETFLKFTTARKINSRDLLELRLLLMKITPAIFESRQYSPSFQQMMRYAYSVERYLNFDFDNALKSLVKTLSDTTGIHGEHYDKSLLLLSEIYYKMNDDENYNRYFGKTNKRDPDIAINITMKKIEEMIKKRKFYQALNILEKINSSDINILYSKFICSYKIKPENSIDFLNEMINSHPEESFTRKAVYFYAKYLKNIREYASAVKFLENSKPALGFEIPHTALLCRLYKITDNAEGLKKTREQLRSMKNLDEAVKKNILD